MRPIHFKLDSLDKKILSYLMKNARIPFTEIARKCKVSGAAIHQRVQRMQETQIIAGSQYLINQKAMGYSTCAFIGIQVNLTAQSTHDAVFKKLLDVPEIVECHHISGKYSLLIKIYTHDNEHLKKTIVEKIQIIPEITNTETFVSLQAGFERALPIE